MPQPYTAISHLHYSLDMTAAALRELEDADRLRSAWAWCVLEELPPNHRLRVEGELLFPRGDDDETSSGNQ
jgi:hypothetical protein